MQRQIRRHTCSDTFSARVQDSALPRLELSLRQSKLSPWRAENAVYPKGTEAVNHCSYTFLFLKAEYISRHVLAVPDFLSSV
jgi:hypothetical protein